MKYMISWFERPQGSPVEYENVQKRILEVFSKSLLANDVGGLARDDSGRDLITGGVSRQA
jgi:hypothetical protein